MGEWHKYKQPDPDVPCSGCQVGWGSFCHKIVDGEDYYKTETCQETCKTFKDYQEVTIIDMLRKRDVST